MQYMKKITITLSTETHNKLEKLGRMNQSFDNLVSELIEFKKNYHE